VVIIIIATNDYHDQYHDHIHDLIMILSLYNHDHVHDHVMMMTIDQVIMNILRGDVARLQRCTAITTSSEEMISRLYLYICFVLVLYLFFMLVLYLSCICLCVGFVFVLYLFLCIFAITTSSEEMISRCGILSLYLY